jgi:outer membrane receptor protein involved in Fe transport
VWKPVTAWVVEAGVRLESSVITQSGDSPLEREFIYAKPRVSVDWAVDDANDLRLAYTREVGQLDFGDFVASASLQTGAVSAGNAQLEPDKTSRWAASWERRFSGDAAVKLTWMHDDIADVVDRVLVTVGGGQFDAPGNIGKGKAEAIQLDITTPLDTLGLAGGQLKSSMTWRSSSVADPATGERRRISEQVPIEGFISLTQDIPALALNWGAEINHAEGQTSYRFDEVVRSSEALSWALFAEWRFAERWTLRAEAANLFGRSFSEHRTRHEGVRSSNPIDELQDRNWEAPGYVTLSIRHSMGG